MEAQLDFAESSIQPMLHDADTESPSAPDLRSICQFTLQTFLHSLLNNCSFSKSVRFLAL